ncbi:hypothetical protein L1887_32639 [Cichorium endivia]|nr:hypothetical protein L1887_32639 [Cichorium endivia]
MVAGDGTKDGQRVVEDGSDSLTSERSFDGEECIVSQISLGQMFPQRVFVIMGRRRVDGEVVGRHSEGAMWLFRLRRRECRRAEVSPEKRTTPERMAVELLTAVSLI